MNGSMAFGVVTAMLAALLIADVWLYRLVPRALFRLVDKLPPFRRNGRYRSQSTPELYASLRKPRNRR